MMRSKLIHLFLCVFFLLSSTSFSRSLVLGVNAHLYSKSKQEIARSLDKIKSLGFESVRIDAPWKVVEKKAGEYEIPEIWDYIVDYANKKELSILFILDYGNKYYSNGDKPISKNAVDGFKNYVDYLTKHFSGKVKYYQIWNEWNSHDGDTLPGTVTDYKNIVKVIYPIIKKNDSRAIVITSSFSPAAFNKPLGIENKGDYLRDFMSPDMARYTDALSIHPYTTYRKPPFDDFTYYTKQIDYAILLVRENIYFKDKPIFITEIGWTTANSKYSVSQRKQSSYLISAICEAKQRGYAGVFIYEFKDNVNNNDPEQGFGVLNEDWTNKESGDDIQAINCVN